MKAIRKRFKKGTAVALTAALLAGLVPALPGATVSVKAADGTTKSPSVSTYATKDQLMDDTFKPNSKGTAETVGKLVFGKNSDGNPQEWYILGADSGVSGGKDNTIIFATSPIATKQVFENDSSNNKTFDSSFGVYASNPTEVYPNHYGASDLRVALKSMANGLNENYFTTAEQNLMNATTVTTKDRLNNATYTTTDKLYALQGDFYDLQKLRAGTSDSTVLARYRYWSSGGDEFWLRTAYVSKEWQALLVIPYQSVDQNSVSTKQAVQPASNLDLSSVLFASAATAASSDTAKSGTIASDKAMTLRLDGTGKDIGTVTYNITTGDIKVVKGSTAQPVSLVVQGNDGTNDWYYNKQITGTETVNASDIKSALSLTSDIDLSACKIWLETTDNTENLTYAVNATEIVVSVSSVAITDIDIPTANTALDTSASCTTTGVRNTAPQITWTPSATTAGYNASYTARITLTADTGYAFTDSTTATINGNTATSVKKNVDGTLTVTYAFPATAKDKLTSITAPQAITVANGTAYSAMNLPDQVNIVTEGKTESSAQVTWDTTTPASGSYDPSVLTEQTVTLKGTVTCPDSINANGSSLTTTITITISAAGIVGAPTANPTAGIYTENQSVTLTSSTEGATIYYTTDGSEPTITGGATSGTTAEYTAPIAVTGTEGQNITTTIKAIAVKSGMQDSSVKTFNYIIKQESQTPDVTAPSIATQPGNATVKVGETANFTIVASGTDITYQWQIDRNDGNGWANIDGATATSYTTSAVDISCNGFKYQCVVSNSAGTVTSNTAVLTVTESTPTKGDYQIIDGANGKHTIGKDGTLTFRSNAPFSEFKAVLVDGVIVDPSNYDVSKGSTIVRLKQSFLDTLSKGSHTIAIQSIGGTATANFSVTASSNSGNTGSATTPTPSAPTAGITNVQPNGGTPAASNTNNQAAQKTTVNAKAPVTGEASPMASVILALLIAGGLAVILVGVCKMRKHCK